MGRRKTHPLGNDLFQLGLVVRLVLFPRLPDGIKQFLHAFSSHGRDADRL
jgi:hypothetical protein